MTKTEFIEAIGGRVQKYAPSYDICVYSPIIAQAILESNWGESALASVYHNYFGLKCGSSWTGASVNMSTQEEYAAGVLTTIKDNFRVYDSMDDGVLGYFEFIQLDRYSNLKGITDPEEYLQTIKADGYATSSTYVESCMSLIEQYNLIEYDNEITMSEVIFGSARSDSRGKYSGDAPGDQKQTTTPDYSGEVSLQTGYVHSKGWRIFRFYSAAHAKAMADAMMRACNNENLGYNQGNRLGVIKYGTNTAVKTDADCSSLARQCFIEATGTDPGNFTTANEMDALLATGLGEEVEFTSISALITGDTLVTKTKGHTVVTVQGKDISAVVYPCWIQSGDDWYYRLAEAANAHGWLDILNADDVKRRYYFAEDGKMVMDWQLIGDSWYYFQPSGGLAGAMYVSDADGRQTIATY